MDPTLLYLTIAAALFFDFTNGFHDTANIVSTAISTRAIAPKAAVALTAILNFVGAFISVEVAATVGSGIVSAEAISLNVIFAGLVGAILWNLVTWWFGLPSSSSHALIGGLVGATIVVAGLDGIFIDGLLFKVIIPAFAAIPIAFISAMIFITVCYIIFSKTTPKKANKLFRLGQLPTSALLALAHGTNDAQKTMGVIVLALITYGAIDPANFHVPTWVIISAASAIALGTCTGGWRIIKTIGTRIIKMDPAQGFAAQTTGSFVILISSLLGYPLSTTHVISSSIMGVGAAKKVSAVRWGVAKNIAVAWIITLPGAAAMGAVAYWIVMAIASLF